MMIELGKLSTWLKTESEKHPYSEITLRLIVHDGQMRRIEKTVTEKIKQCPKAYDS